MQLLSFESGSVVAINMKKNYILQSSLHQLHAVYIHSLLQLLYHLFSSQTADPSLSKATKVARLQLAYQPGSSSSQRALLLSALSYASPVTFPFPSFLISHFFVPRSWFTSSQILPDPLPLLAVGAWGLVHETGYIDRRGCRLTSMGLAQACPNYWSRHLLSPTLCMGYAWSSS